MPSQEPPHSLSTVASRSGRIKVGLLGCGTVGSRVAERLLAGFLPGGSETRFELAKVAVLHPDKERSVRVPSELYTADAGSVVTDPSIDIVIELIGGTDPAESLIRTALSAGKAVVTANKELIARRGAELLELAAAHRTTLFFEGAAGGAVPMVSLFREIVVGDRVLGFTGIVNGTSNHILTFASANGGDLATALAEARELGYAEADPAADVSGFDAACKTAILASLAFRRRIPLESIHVQGIDSITPADILAARSFGYVIKPVISVRDFGSCIEARVEPVALSGDHPLAAVNGRDNGLIVDLELAGRLTLTGPGAGGAETASAVLADLGRTLSQQPREAVDELDEARTSVAREVPAGFIVRCDREPHPDLEPAIRGHLFSHGLDVDRVASFVTAQRSQVAFAAVFGEPACITRAVRSIPELGNTDISLIKIGTAA